jgi:lysophospholipase L1-like esterase
MNGVNVRLRRGAMGTARIVFVAAAVAANAAAVSAQSVRIGTSPGVDEHWVPTWGTAQQLIRTPPPPPPSPAQPSANQPPQPAPRGTGTAAPAGVPAAPPFRVTTVTNQTVRMILRTSINGRRARVRLTNAFGSSPVTVGAAHLARRAGGSAIVPASDRRLTFGGQQTFTMMPGVVVVSDPVDLDVPALSDLAVSLYFPDDTGSPTTHSTGLRPTYVSTEGDFAGRADMPLAGTTQQYYWLSSVEVVGSPDAAAIVAFGDSITDGARSTPDTNHSWPALLAARLRANKATANISVVNEGIGGNRLLTDAVGLAGVSALARFDRDVLSHPGVKWLMVLEGINDIGTLGSQTPPATPVTSDALIWVLRQLIDRAHAHGIKVIGCTLTPYEGAGYARENGEVIRETVNRWIRTSGAFDAVVDFDAATRDPNNPKRLRPAFDPGDHLHPNDAGYAAMADAVDLSIFASRGRK